MAKKPDMPAPINWDAISALNSGVRRCLDIIKQDIGQIQPGWAQEAVTAHLLINLHDVLRILDRAGHRLIWTEDLPADHDVTAQVKIVRDAMCHIGSGRRDVDEFKNSLHFGWCTGKCVLMKSNEQTLENPYEDEQALFMGHHRLLVKRHLHRCILEAARLAPEIAKAQGHHWFPIEN
jgi:hypothetical protein